MRAHAGAHHLRGPEGCGDGTCRHDANACGDRSADQRARVARVLHTVEIERVGGLPGVVGGRGRNGRLAHDADAVLDGRKLVVEGGRERKEVCAALPAELKGEFAGLARGAVRIDQNGVDAAAGFERHLHQMDALHQGGPLLSHGTRVARELFPTLELRVGLAFNELFNHSRSPWLPCRRSWT